MNQRIFRAVTLLAIIATGLMGCGKKSDSPGDAVSATKQTPTVLATNPVLQSVLTTWQQGDKATAISHFVETDWRARPLFGADSVLSLSEEQFKSLPTSDREAKSRELIAQTGALKQLAAAVAQAGLEAAATNQTAQARKYLSSLKECGTALDGPGSLALLKLVGQGMKIKANSDLSKLGL